jgi:hypothetical protein
MPKIIFLSAWLLAGCVHLEAQTISDCAGAIQLCESYYFEEQAPLNTGDFGEFTGTCNQFVEWNSVWYTFTVQSDGNLGFILSPNDLNDDYDWGLFDITAGGCEGITLQDGSSPEVSCNSWGTLTPPNGATGISTEQGGVSNSSGPGDQFGPPFNADLPVLAGHTFALVVMNWTGSSSGYGIDFGESTAVLFDAIPPQMTGATVDCNNLELTLSFSEEIVTSTAQILDFLIVGPDQVTIMSVQPTSPGDLNDQLSLLFTEEIAVPGTYQLIITDAAGLIEDPCGNTALDTIEFVVNLPLQYDGTIEPACNGFDGSFMFEWITPDLQNMTTTIDGLEVNESENVLLDAGDHLFVATDPNGCGIEVNIFIPNETLNFYIVSADTITCLDPVSHIVTNVASNQENLSYLWTGPEGNNVFSALPNPDVASPGVYNCTVTTVPNGCSVVDSHEVFASEVYTIDDQMLVWPNIVSANQDGHNDYWAPRLINAPDFDLANLIDVFDLHIYDRWGKEVFANETGEAWYPRAGQRGVYFYTVKYHVDCGESALKIKEGTIQVVE